MSRQTTGFLLFYHDSLTTTDRHDDRVIDLSSARVEERLPDGNVIVVEVFRDPLLGHRLLIQLDISLRDDGVVGLITCVGGVFVLGTECAGRFSTTSWKRKRKDRRKCVKIK